MSRRVNLLVLQKTLLSSLTLNTNKAEDPDPQHIGPTNPIKEGGIRFRQGNLLVQKNKLLSRLNLNTNKAEDPDPSHFGHSDPKRGSGFVQEIKPPGIAE